MRPTCFLACIGFTLVAGSEADSAEIHDAARRGNLVAIERLLASGVRVDATDSGNATALYLAAAEGHAAIVTRLLAAGANPRHQAMGFQGSIGTPIHAAAIYGRVDVVRLLLEAGVDPNLPDEGVGPPLHMAVEAGQKAVEDLLRSFGARSIPAEPVDGLVAMADLALGKDLGWGGCVGCHELTKHPGQLERSGPPLWGVVGRPKAGVPGFKYSEALQRLGGRWTYGDLSSFIANPRRFVPGTKMRFRGIAERQSRAALIAYLRTLSDHPPPLP